MSKAKPEGMKAMSNETITIVHGALARKLLEQLRRIGIRIRVDARSRFHHLQLDADAINRLLIRGVITHGEAHNARQRLNAQIVKAVEQSRARGSA